MKKSNPKYQQQNINNLSKDSINIKEKKNTSILYFVIAFFAPVLLYMQTLKYGFTHFDDNGIILNNINFLSKWGNVSKAFLTNAFINKPGSFYRPLQTLSYMIDIKLSGVNETWMYHLTNILLIGLIAGLLFLFLKRLLIPVKVALISSLIFCLHPLFTSSVAWIPARGDLQLTMFSLLTFIFLIDYLQNKKIVYLALHWFTFTIVLFCKETAAFLPFLFITYYLIFHYKKSLEKRYLINILLYALSGLFWMWVRSKAIVSINKSDSEFGLSALIANLRIIPESLAKFFIPSDIAPIPFFSVLNTLIGVILLVSIIILFIKNKERLPKEKMFCISWFAILMFPPMLYKSPDIDYLDHRFFLPLVGILLFVLYVIPKKWLIKKDIKLISLVVVVIIFLSSFTFIKSQAYVNQKTFYNTAISQNTNSAFIYNNRGNERINLNDFDNALEDFNNAIKLNPGYAEAYNNRGNIKSNKRDFKGAMKDYDQALAIDSKYADVYNNRGLVKSQLNDKPGAIKDFTSAITFMPNYANAYFNRGNAKASNGDNNGAIDDYNKAIDILPNHADAIYARGFTKANIGDNTGAIEDYNKAINIRPNFVEVYNNKGILLGKMGNYQEAITEFNKAIEINPNYIDAYYDRAVTKQLMKDLTGAINDCDIVLKLDPKQEKAIVLKNNIQIQLQKNSAVKSISQKK